MDIFSVNLKQEFNPLFTKNTELRMNRPWTYEGESVKQVNKTQCSDFKY